MEGSCECGSVRFGSDGPWRDVVVCHCTQCRKTAGHAWAATSVPATSLRFKSDAGLTWYASSDRAERGYCARCGSSLFYRPHGEDRVAIGAGCLEAPTGLKTVRDIFLSDAGDYYDIAGGPAVTPRRGPVTGSCDCGGVALRITGTLSDGWFCHCDQCRKASGHFWAGAQLHEGGYDITADRGLRWYRSTDTVKKGFCGGCGGTIFWWLEGRAAPAVSLGALDRPTGARSTRHIFVAERGDYHRIDDGLPQAAQFDLDAGG